MTTASQTQGLQAASLAQFALYFLKLGCIGFGGPIALVGYMQKDLVEDRRWVSREDYVNGLASRNSRPDPWQPSWQCTWDTCAPGSWARRLLPWSSSCLHLSRRPPS